MISLYPGFLKSESKNPNTGFFTDLEKFMGLKVYPFSSARAALVFALKALGFNRRDEVLVPPFLSDCVISAISKTAFPTMVATGKTRAIYVFHQFGFPQAIEAIELKAKQEGWVIINCCVHSLYTKYKNKLLANWGDFTILSLPKLYPCGLGGGLITKNEKIVKSIDEDYEKLFNLHKKWADRAYDILLDANQSQLTLNDQFNIESVYGFLPNTVAFPSGSYNSLPNNKQSIIEGINRRKDLLKSVEGFMSGLMQDNKNDGVVPFALPLKMNQKKIRSIKDILRRKCNAEPEILHFDYNQNMLNSNYRKGLLVGCHDEWSSEIIMTVLNN